MKSKLITITDRDTGYEVSGSRAIEAGTLADPSEGGESYAPIIDSYTRLMDGLTQVDVNSLKPGDVAIVRSKNVPQYGDHWFMVTGGLIPKPHGLRPQGIVIKGCVDAIRALDQFTPLNGVTVLKLSPSLVKRFTSYYRLADIVF